MLFENLKKLCAVPGISGCEDSVRDAIIGMIEGHCSYEIDALGNLLAFKKGVKRPAQTRMFSAHMDEVGLIVTYIEESGLLRFTTVGGIDRRVLAGKSVRIGEVFGVIGAKPVHLKTPEERDKAPEKDDMFIDIGADNAEQARALVSLGQRAVFQSQYGELGDGFLRGRALDDRAGCALMVELIRSPLAYDTWFAFTVQEEIGAVGAKTATARIKPQIAIVVETTTACDIPDVAKEKTVCALGQGPVLSFMDRGTVYDMELYKQTLALAKERGITCQSKAGVFGGNEARSVQTTGEGARVLAVSVPCRYLHTPSCVTTRFDISETGKLLAALADTLGA